MISNLDYYKTFFYVANVLSFTKAAELLYVSQSAVSQTIRKLEGELGCTLFSRSSRGLLLTKAGEELYLHVQRAIEDLNRGENILLNMREDEETELNIGATETSVRYFITPAIRRVRENHPGIKISFRGGNTRDLCRMLQDGEIDIALLISPVPAEFRFDLQRVLEFQDMVAASAELDLDFERTYRLSELKAFPLITVDANNQVRKHFDEWFLQEGEVLSPDFTVQSMGLVLPFIRSRMGIGILPEPFIREDLDSGQIRQVRTVSLPEKRILYIATRAHTQLTRTGLDFCEELKQA